MGRWHWSQFWFERRRRFWITRRKWGSQEGLFGVSLSELLWKNYCVWNDGHELPSWRSRIKTNSPSQPEISFNPTFEQSRENKNTSARFLGKQWFIFIREPFFKTIFGPISKGRYHIILYRKGQLATSFKKQQIIASILSLIGSVISSSSVLASLSVSTSEWVIALVSSSVISYLLHVTLALLVAVWRDAVDSFIWAQLCSGLLVNLTWPVYKNCSIPSYSSDLFLIPWLQWNQNGAFHSLPAKTRSQRHIHFWPQRTCKKFVNLK